MWVGWGGVGGGGFSLCLPGGHFLWSCSENFCEMPGFNIFFFAARFRVFSG